MTLRNILFLFGFLTALAGAGGCASVLNASTSRDGIAIQNGLRYAQGERGSYDLYIPENAGPDTPVVVFFYGGSWDSGDRGRHLFVGQSLASAGVIVAIPDYRLYPAVTFPGFVEDGARAVAAVSQAARGGQAGIPAGDHPIFLMGHSAGAHIAALLNYDERYLRGAGASTAGISGFIGLAGPYDFLPLTSDRYRSIFPEPTREASQPINFVDGSEPPALLLTGEADDTVEPRNSLALAEAVRGSGGQAEVRTFPGVSHVGAVTALSTVLPGDSGIREAILAFIRSRS